VKYDFRKNVKKISQNKKITPAPYKSKGERL